MDAYTLEEPTTRKRRARSMDVALGLKRPPGRPKGTQSDRLQTAIDIHYLWLRGESWNEIADRFRWTFARFSGFMRRTRMRIVEHLFSRGYLVPLGYDLKDGKLVVNKSEAATVRMIFERFAQLGSAARAETRTRRALRNSEAEGITGKRGKPIDKGYLYQAAQQPRSTWARRCTRACIPASTRRSSTGRSGSRSTRFVGCYAAETGVKKRHNYARQCQGADKSARFLAFHGLPWTS